MLNKRVLILNADFTPLQITGCKQAIKKVYQNMENRKIGVEVIDFYKDEHILDSAGRKHPVPAVVRKPSYVKKNHRKVPFSRNRVFVRDGFKCAYCLKRLPPDKLTYDHVIPKSKWKKSSSPTCWENIVTSCYTCNRKKADKTPDQAKMPLKIKPEVPNFLNTIIGISHWKHKIPNEWVVYLKHLPGFEELYNSAT
jgi:5-methylcytosine-specific restriction endonuclease McrA